MQFGILGPLVANGAPAPLGGPRLRVLLALLVLDAGRIAATRRLIDELWDDPPEKAAGALQSQVSRLRSTLGPDLVEFHPAGYRLVVNPDDVDVHRFERLAREGRSALDTGDLRKATGALSEALELWRGPVASEVPQARAVRLDERRLAAIEDRIEAELRLGRHDELVEELRDLLADHPLRERPAAQLMRVLHACGRQAEALRVFADIRARLADELGADPSAELAAAHLTVLQEAQPYTPFSTPPGRLTTFVGRSAELARIRGLLARRRLITLTGPGGAGKTRLVIEFAASHNGDMCFVPLAEEVDVTTAALKALGLRETGLLSPKSHEAEGRLLSTLADRRLLLILDNCEHVVEGAAALAEKLLAGCPGLRILATGREPLGVDGEILCPVPQLPLPDAIALFAERAAAVYPGPIADEVVEEICRELDGLPLAIELAAARLRSLPPEEIAARLGDRFRLLSRGSRTAAPRHRTLHAVVAWSWDLLTEAEQRLARRLGVFAGGATLESAAAVCDVAADEIDDLMAGLVDKSLIEADNGRYRMLETIRAFCADRLAASGEAVRLRHAYLAYFLDLAITADPHLRRAEQLHWLQRLDAEQTNLHAALRQAIELGDTASAFRMFAALAMYWWLRGQRAHGGAIASELLTAAGPEPPPGLAEEHMMCTLYASLAAPVEWSRLETADSMVIYATGKNRYPFLNVLYHTAIGPPRFDIDTLSADLDPAGLDPWAVALGHFGRGLIHGFQGAAAAAERCLREALTLLRSQGERWATALTLSELSAYADREAFFALTDEALALLNELGSAVDIAEVLSRRADRLLEQDDLDRARGEYERAAEYARQGGAPERRAMAYRGLAEIARLGGDLGEARSLGEIALGWCTTRWFSAEDLRAAVLLELGRIARAEGAPDEARSRYHEVSAIASRHPLPDIGAAAIAEMANLSPDQ